MLDHSDSYFQVDHMSGVLAWTQRGFVLACQGVANIGSDPPGAEAVAAGKLIEYMKRVYDFGSIDGRDFNGDGLINATDVSDYNAAYALYGGKTTGCNWAHGDMNQDNDVDSSDQVLYNHRRMSLFPVTINLGTAEPNDALTK
ncbi:MAG: hypothetical protein IT435_20320 [Phycisphaerales bacterium]|nr:hypothetical protein [Phycisphaerales bacterium]